MKKRYITVPKNSEVDKQLDVNLATDDELIEVVLDEDQYLYLSKIGLFDGINEIAMVNIDDHEDEVVSRNIKDIIKLLNNLIKANTINKEILIQIKNLFEEACRLNMKIYFFF